MSPDIIKESVGGSVSFSRMTFVVVFVELLSCV